MLWNRLNLILLIWPIILLLGFFGNASFQRHQIDKKLLSADGLVWKAGVEQFVVRVNQREDGELLHIDIKVITPENKEVYKKMEVIDRDMFGGGFVRAAQVDQDSENEIIVWQARAKYLLDFSEGNVTEVSFDQVSQQVKNLAESWYKYNIMASLEMTILIIFILSYYTMYILVKGIKRLFKKKKYTD